MIANKFNKYFISVGELTAYKANLITREYGLDEECGSSEESIDTGLHVETEGFEFQDVKETDFKSVIKSVAANKAPGYDKISARVLKDSCERIAPVISRLVNNSFKLAAFPNAWKIAEVIPVPEEGNSEEPVNNRPISLLPILSKVSERLAHKLISQGRRSLQRLDVTEKVLFNDLVLVFKCVNGLAPDYLGKYFIKRSAVRNKKTRGRNNFVFPRR